MIKSFTSFNSNGTNELVIIDNYPDVCPVCHNGVEPHLLSGYVHNAQVLYVTFYCTRLKCKALFIGVYSHGGSNNFFLESTLLGKLQVKDFSEIVRNISKSFTEIYDQSAVAEHIELDEICGPGYRNP